LLRIAHFPPTVVGNLKRKKHNGTACLIPWEEQKSNLGWLHKLLIGDRPTRVSSNQVTVSAKALNNKNYNPNGFPRNNYLDIAQI
jgi:hypothetical protein